MGIVIPNLFTHGLKLLLGSNLTWLFFFFFFYSPLLRKQRASLVSGGHKSLLHSGNNDTGSLNDYHLHTERSKATGKVWHASTEQQRCRDMCVCVWLVRFQCGWAAQTHTRASLLFCWPMRHFGLSVPGDIIIVEKCMCADSCSLTLKLKISLPVRRHTHAFTWCWMNVHALTDILIIRQYKNQGK